MTGFLSPPIRKSGWRALIGLIAIIALLGIVFEALNRAPGRWLAARVLNGEAVGGYGSLEVGGISGRLFSDVSVDHIRLLDNDGAWLEARNVEIVWNAMALLGNRVEVQSVQIGRIEMLRRPVLDAPEAVTNPGPALAFERVSLSRLVLAEAVLGRRFELEALAGIDDLNNEAGEISLEVRGLGGTQDRLTLDMQRTLDGALAGELELIAPADGLLVRAIGVPERALHVEGSLNGRLSSGTGDLRFTSDGASAAEAVLDWSGSDWRLGGVAFPAAFLASEAVLPGRMQLSATGRNQSIWPDTLELESDALRIGLSRGGASAYDANLSANPAALGWLDGIPASVDGLDWQGVIDRETSSATGLLTLSGVSGQGYAMDQLAGPVSASTADAAWRVSIELQADGLSTLSPMIDGQLGETPSLSASGVWRPDDDRLTLSRLSFEAANLVAEAQGSLWPGTQLWSLTGNLGVRDLALFHPSIRGQAMTAFELGVDAAGETGLRAELDLSASSLPDWAQAVLANARIDARSTRGEVLAPEINIEAEGLIVSSRAVLDADTGAWRLTGDAAVNLPSSQALAVTGSVVGAFEADMLEGETSIRTEVFAESLALDAVSFQQPRLRSQIELTGGGAGAQWWFDAQSSLGSFALAGDVQQGEADSFVLQLAGKAGPATAEARASLRDEVMTASLTLIEAADAPSWRIATDLFDTTLDLSDGELRADLESVGMPLPGGQLDRAILSLQGPFEAIAMSGSLSGEYAEPFALELAGIASLSPDVQRIELDTIGQAGSIAITTTTPIALSHVDGEVSVDGTLSLGGGNLRAAAQWRAQRGRLTLDGQVIPAALFTQLSALAEIAGVIDLEADLALQGEAITGAARVTGHGLAPASLERADPVDIELALEADAQTRLNARLSSATLSGETTLIAAERLEASRLAGLASLEGWTGAARLDGDIEGLSALILPAGETLAGRFQVALAKPANGQGAWSGDVAVSGGRYTSATSGIGLSDIMIDANIADGALELVAASARDRAAGTLTGSGQIRWRNDRPSGALRADFSNLRLVDRSDASVTASGHAEISLGEREILVTGQTQLDEARITPPENGAAAILEIEVEEINLPDGAEPVRRSIPLRLDYAVSAPSNIFISSRTFDTEWSADLAITGRLNALSLDGQAALISGQAFLLNRPFRMRSGRVTFSGPATDADIALSAQHQRPGFEAIIDIGGTLRTPSVTMSSEPELPQDEIFARLLFDRSASSLSSLETAQLAAALSGRNLLTMVARLRAAAGVDRLDVASSDGGDVIITGGRRFGDNLYVEIETGTSDSLGSARVEWSLTPDISVLSRLTGDTDAEVSVRWRSEYD